MDIAARLEAARRDLLDLTLRNPLLNHRASRARGVQVVDEVPALVHRLLWDEEKTLSFTAAKEAAPGDAAPADLPPLPDAPAARHSDAKLQTAHDAERLQARLIATARDARFVEEERGVNVLHLALGYLRWREADAAESDPWRLAPLWLVPVQLARARADAQWTLACADNDPLANLSLAVKLKSEFGITLPEAPAADGADLAAWFAAVATAVAVRPGWRVEPRIGLDLFSFGRLLMWRDLDPAAWPAGAGPAERGLVQRLFGGGFAPAPLVTDLDGERSPERAGEVVESDASQAEALAAVAAGADLVIQGPPGTGKSQTICNLIAQAVRSGRSVLFVAEKMAALSVVQRRMNAVGLGDLCLELHSDKVAKRAVLGEVGRTLKLGRPVEAPGDALDRDYAAVRSELSALASALAAPVGRSGLAPGAAIDLLAGIGDADSLPTLPDGTFAADSDAAAIASSDAAARELQGALARTGPLAAHPWGEARISQLLPDAEAALRGRVAAAQDALVPARAAAAALAAACAAETPAGSGATRQLLAAARHLAARPPGCADPENPAWATGAAALDLAFAAGAAYAAVRATHDATLIPEAWEQDLVQVRADLAAYGEGLFRFVSGAWRAANSRLKGLCRGPAPKAHAEQLALVDAVLAARRHAAAVRQHDSVGTALFGAAWQGAGSDWRGLAAARSWAHAWGADRAGGWPACRATDPTTVRTALDTQAPALERWIAAEDALAAALGATAEDATWDTLAARRAAMAARSGEIHDVCAVNRAAEPLAALPGVVALARSWDGAGSRLADALRAGRLRALLARALAERPALARFDAAAHDRARARFADLDRQVLGANRTRIAAAHWARLPGPTAGGQAGLLRRESEKKARHLPLRSLLREAGAAVQRVKPVFLMSPQSVAAFLEPGGLEFDLVVFDEASQVRPVDAVGALARARQAVVVGDSRQMPPTAFFDRLVGADPDADGEDANYAADLESVLGLFVAAGAPDRMLRWHYRSRHPSLIATSNREFYDGRLVVFPSPAGAPAADGDGLTLRHLPEARYDRARTRTNPAEAAAVAAAVMDHAKRFPQLSLGVAAFSQAQMDAISSAVERARRADPACEPFFAANPNEPFFVKNLENVQGDERDVILISVGYGRDNDGGIALNFGPLNLDGGERRLNVLITRARRRMVVFTNLLPEDIDPKRSQALGVLALRTFLAFARDGRLAGGVAGASSGVAARLAAGVAGAVPVGEGGIALRLGEGSGATGVLLDDDAWCASRTTRDRERLAAEVLTGLGWRIHRAWRLGWWRRPGDEAARITAAPASPAAPAVQPQPRRDDGHPPEDPPAPGAYRLARPDVPIEGKSLVGMHPERIAAWAAEVVAIEAPVHRDRVRARISDAASGRVPAEVQAALDAGIDLAAAKGAIRLRGAFCWSADAREAVARTRSDADERKPELIAPEEWAAAIVLAVRAASGLRPEECGATAGRLLGLRPGPGCEAAASAAVALLLGERRLRQRGDWLLPA